MFFRTQLKTVGAGGAMDMQGRRLNFIGYLPVAAGDWVYTDGNVIFGNVKPKGAPAIFAEQSGVPILADDLRGYFSSRGTFKPYNIAPDDWISNSKHHFFHGLDSFNSDKIIDAYTADNGDEFIVTNGIFREVNGRNTACLIARIRDPRSFADASDLENGVISVVGQIYSWAQILGVKGYPTEYSPVNLFVNGDLKQSLDLRPYATDVQNRALLIANQIMAQSYEGTEPYPYIMPSTLYYGYNRYYPQTDESRLDYPGSPFLAYTVAYVQTCNVSDTAFDGTVYASTYGYCFPYIKSRLRLFISYMDFDPFANYASGVVAKRHKVAWDTWVDRFGTSADGIAFEGNLQLREWLCVPFGVSCIYRISTTDDPVPIVIHCAGNRGIQDVAFDDRYNRYPALSSFKDGYSMVPFGSSSTYRYSYSAWEKRQIYFSTSAPEKEWTDLLPVGDGFYTLDKFGRLSFFDSKGNTVAENIPIHDNFCNVEIDWNSFSMQEQTFRATNSFYVDSEKVDAEQVYTTYTFLKYNSNTGRSCELFNHKPNSIHHTVFTPDGNELFGMTKIHETILPVDGAEYAEEAGDPGNDVYHSTALNTDFLPVDGYYIKKNDSLEPLQFTPLFFQFKNGAYLFGVKGGKLYLKTADTIRIVGDGLKNFRLNELKKISKAKK